MRPAYVSTSADPLARTVGEVLVFPNRNLGLEIVDQPAARGEGRHPGARRPRPTITAASPIFEVAGPVYGGDRGYGGVRRRSARRPSAGARGRPGGPRSCSRSTGRAWSWLRTVPMKSAVPPAVGSVIAASTSSLDSASSRMSSSLIVSLIRSSFPARPRLYNYPNHPHPPDSASHSSPLTHPLPIPPPSAASRCTRATRPRDVPLGCCPCPGAHPSRLLPRSPTRVLRRLRASGGSARGEQER